MIIREGLIHDPDQLMFPATNDLGGVTFGKGTPSKEIQEILNMLLDIASFQGEKLPKYAIFSIHCFRRGIIIINKGGAQHRYFNSGKEWTLVAIYWWGGWCQNNESRTQLITYILNEYESRLYIFNL